MNFESDTSAYNDGYENGQDECKQRVREAIEKIKKISDISEETDCAGFFHELEPIFKELGLLEENV